MEKLKLTFQQQHQWYYIFGSTTFCIGIVLKWWLSNAELNYFDWLLVPTVVGVEVFTTLTFDFHDAIDFVCDSISPTHIIDRSCAGFNFWLMAFWLGGFVLADEVKSLLSAGICLLIASVVAWCLAIIANVGRIVLSVRILPLLDTNYETTHLLVGIFTYLPTLILYFWGLISMLKLKK